MEEATQSGSFFSPSTKVPQRSLLQERLVSRNQTYKPHYDRFIPNRAAMDFDIGQYLMVDSKKDKPATITSPSQEAYQKRLAEVCLKNRTRILAFRSKPPEPVESVMQEICSSPERGKFVKPRRSIPQSAERTLDAPELLDDYYLNLLDWSSNNVLAIALGSSVYLWDASEGTASEMMSVDEDTGPITSINWAPDGRHLAVGLNSSAVHLWDASVSKQLRTLRGGHQARVGCLAWNSHILTTGGRDGLIFNNDVRIRAHIVEEYKGHEQEVCGLQWSSTGQQLASGGNDNLLYIWDRTSAVAASQNARTTQWLHRLEDHRAAVKALAWCPFQGNLLASGGGSNDRCIKFWNTHTGSCLNSVDTGSQVCALLWNKTERELLSSHGSSQLTLWKYPSMVKMAELSGHTSRVLFMAQSPDGCTVASASAGDETLRFWNVFGNPEANKKPISKPAFPFANVNTIRSCCSLKWLNSRQQMNNQPSLAYELAGVSWVRPTISWLLIVNGYWNDLNRAIVYKEMQLLLMLASLFRNWEWKFVFECTIPKSPDGCTVASASAEDETLRFWNVFGNPIS